MFDQQHNPSPNERQTVTSPEREAAIAWFWNQYIAIIHEKGVSAARQGRKFQRVRVPLQ